MNRSASLAMSTSVLKALPGKLDIKRHSPSILYILVSLLRFMFKESDITDNIFVIFEIDHHLVWRRLY